MLKLTFFLFVLFFVTSMPQSSYDNIFNEIAKGNFSNATSLIDQQLVNPSVPDLDKYLLSFEKERMRRIKIDFTKSIDDVKKALAKYYPLLTDDMLQNWITEKSLEMMIIDGENKFFNRAVPNLFRINKDAKLVKQKVDGILPDDKDEFLKFHLPAVMRESVQNNSAFVHPVKKHIVYKLTVDANAVPDGEIIRCWLPFPKSMNRQNNINLIETNVPNYILSDESFFHKSLYLEKKSQKDLPTEFIIEYEYTSTAHFNKLHFNKVYTIDKNSQAYKLYTGERLPHILFSDLMKDLSHKIVGNEKNSVKIAKLIFEWIDLNIPWASAREYSTIQAIPAYCVENKHGDCGIQTLLFMTLCRLNGIPAKWQSGWMSHPGSVNLHDWCQIYFDQTGWIPVDQSFGLQPSDDPALKYFYLGSIDSYRLVVNEDYSKDFFPAKIYPRSETVDFQRGEVEWRGGNIYFDKWDYNMKIDYLTESPDEK